jgi:hypothetical protein
MPIKKKNVATKNAVEELNLEESGEEMTGLAIHDIFKQAEVLARWHSTLTSPRGKFFRNKLLHLLSDGLTAEEIEELRKEFGVEEYARHINKFVELGLIKPQKIDGQDGYIRTEAGEQTVNLTRRLETKLGQDRAEKSYNASLGPNSIRLFLKIYGQDRPRDFASGEIIYTPLEIGRLASFLPRSIEGIAAVDKLDDAGLVSYLDDGRVHVNPRRSVGFYQYLKGLYTLILTRVVE